MKVSLGQLFLLRRELKNEIGTLEASLGPLMAYREDKAAPEEDFSTVFASLTQKKELLYRYDLAVNEANNVPNTVIFNNISLSLSQARIKKMFVSNELNTMSHHVRTATMYKGREETENVWDELLVPQGLRQKKFKFVLMANLSSLKSMFETLTKQASTLDSLIQKADWTLEVDIPDELM